MATRDKDRTIVQRALGPGEDLRALTFVHMGSTVPMGSSAKTLHGVAEYLSEHGIVEKGVNGVFDLIGAFVALTDQRLVLFRQSQLAVRPKPKAVATEVLLDQVTLRWADDDRRPRSRLYHFVFGDDEHFVRRGEQEPDADALVRGLGDRATPMTDTT